MVGQQRVPKLVWSTEAMAVGPVPRKNCKKALAYAPTSPTRTPPARDAGNPRSAHGGGGGFRAE